jgi:hypothetical protein
MLGMLLGLLELAAYLLMASRFSSVAAAAIGASGANRARPAGAIRRSRNWDIEMRQQVEMAQGKRCP